jgi:hypothetical protein
MNKITITLEVTPQQMIGIGRLLDDVPSIRVSTPPSPSHEVGMCESAVEVPTEAKEDVQDKVPVEMQETPVEAVVAPKTPTKGFPKPTPVATRKKGGKKGPKMGAFGRTQEQIEEFAEAEANRTEALDEEEELKEQRRQERLAIKAEKDAVIAEKKADEAREEEVVKSIKEAVSTKKKGAPLPPKPWGNK